MAFTEVSPVTVEHTAQRPSWDCRACDKPWPCDPAREALAAEKERVSLSVYMWMQLEDAARDLPNEPASALFERFIHWTR